MKSTFDVTLVITAVGPSTTNQSTKVGGSSTSGQHEETTQSSFELLLDIDEYSNKFTQVVEHEGKQVRVYYKDKALEEFDAEYAKQLSAEENPITDLEGYKIISDAQLKSSGTQTRGRGKGRGAKVANR